MFVQPKDKRSQQVGGILIAGLGLLLLLANYGLFDNIATPFWAVMFFAGGVAFLGLYYKEHEKWWALIPGFSLLALGAATLGGDAAGSWFLGLIGLGFASVYGSNPKHWWAIIPAGVLLTLAVVAGVNGSLAGPLFFMGLGLTFALLYLLPEGKGKQRWAVYPALILLTSGFINLVFGVIPPITWSILLILAGLFLLWRNWTQRQA